MDKMRKLEDIKPRKRYDEWGNEITEFNIDMNLEERKYYGREFDEKDKFALRDK